MNTHSNALCPPSLSVHLSDEQHVLLEQVSASPSTFDRIRRRAKALLMLDQGLPVREIIKRACMDRRTIYSLVNRHRIGGVRAALLGQHPSLERRNWLALSPMNH